MIAVYSSGGKEYLDSTEEAAEQRMIELKE